MGWRADTVWAAGLSGLRSPSGLTPGGAGRAEPAGPPSRSTELGEATAPPSALCLCHGAQTFPGPGRLRGWGSVCILGAAGEPRSAGLPVDATRPYSPLRPAAWSREEMRAEL